jgi:hypothetical protein
MDFIQFVIAVLTLALFTCWGWALGYRAACNDAAKEAEDAQ